MIILKALRDTSDREIHERVLQGQKDNTFLAAHVEVRGVGSDERDGIFFFNSCSCLFFVLFSFLFFFSFFMFVFHVRL